MHGLPDHRVISGDIVDLHAGHELHRFEVGDKGRRRPRSADDPRGVVVVGDVQLVFHVPMRTQDQRQGRSSRQQRLEVLRGEAVQPRQAIRTRHPDNTHVRQIDGRRAFPQRALLP